MIFKTLVGYEQPSTIFTFHCFLYAFCLNMSGPETAVTLLFTHMGEAGIIVGENVAFMTVSLVSVEV
jgi:hypothetical protein